MTSSANPMGARGQSGSPFSWTMAQVYNPSRKQAQNSLFGTAQQEQGYEPKS
jgi:hypothetical protein